MEPFCEQKIPLNKHIDPRGKLCAIEGAGDIPFEIRRVFYISNVPAGAVRGEHAYTRNEFVLCLAGECTVRIETADACRSYRLRNNDAGLLLPAMTWRTLYDFTPDCVLLVLSDAHFSKEDYIFDRDLFFGELSPADAST